jgi:hypothetical protein
MAVATHPVTEALRHLKVTGPAPAFGYEPCEDFGCRVDRSGLASSCGRPACPACGCSGTNLKTISLLDSAAATRTLCTCGHSWVRGERPVYVLTRAETAECNCPDACERDHANE